VRKGVASEVTKPGDLEVLMPLIHGETNRPSVREPGHRIPSPRVIFSDPEPARGGGAPRCANDH
jgi:hypothetical protein